MTADQSTTIRVMREEIRKLQRAMEGCLSDWGHVLPCYRYKYQTLVQQSTAYKQSIDYLEQMYASHEDYMEVY